MKSVHQKKEADVYLTEGGLHLTEQYDQYTHTTETRTKIERKVAAKAEEEAVVAVENSEKETA